MATKIKKKETWKLPKKSLWSFCFLGISPGDQIEFLYEGVFLNGPEEKFTVADQKKAVTYEYDKGEVYEVYTEPLKTLTDRLLKKRDPKANTNVQPIRFWIHCTTQTKLPDIYDEKRRHYGRRTAK